MKSIIKIACCVLGSVLIGCFANQLETVSGSVFFTLGIILVVLSIAQICKQENR